MSTFDPTILEQTVIEESNATKMDPLPEGEYYPAYIESFKVAAPMVNGEPSPQVNVLWRVDDEALAKKHEREVVQVRQTIWLDVTDQGAIATGPNKNVQLGRLREAIGQNKPGKAWQFSMLEGAGPCKIFVGQRPDKQDPTIIYNEVKRVTSGK